MPAAAAIAIAVVAAGSSGYNAYQSSQANSEAIDEKGKREKLAEKAANEAQAASDKQAADMTKANQNADELSAANALRAAQSRRRNLYSGAGTKGGTVLTGPLGLSGAPSAPRTTKTLLGQ